MNKKHDVKFIIYQSLYIFVVCVIAIKGANIDLTKVIDDNGIVIQTGWAYVDTANNKVISKTDPRILIDTSLFVFMTKEKYENLPIDNRPPLATLTGSFSSGPYEEPPIKDEKKDDPAIEKKIQDEIVLGELDLYKYHDNVINNRGNSPIIVKGITIQPHTAATVRLEGESSVIISSGSLNKTQSVKENKKPQLNWQRLTAMDENTKVSGLQRTTCYRLTINDDFPEQLEVKITGPVTWKKVSENVYDITMNAFGSRTAFDNYIENKESPYQLGFNVTVKDKIAPHSITGQQSFVFGEW